MSHMKKAMDSEAAWAVELEARIASVKKGRFRASEWRKALKRIRQALPKGAAYKMNKESRNAGIE
jgi:hypothetical protein